ncbi:MAG: CPBP family intramembrane metalloprotease, partial [Spirochaetia bacterium]|nr:CPBP family intramembrane metalloprotease [Spirochaetia bacterium]
MVGIVGGLYFFVSQIAASVLILGNAMASGGKGNGHHLILGMTIVFQGLFFVWLTHFIFKNWHGRPAMEYFRIRAAPIHLILASAAGAVVLIPFFSAITEFFLRLFPVLRDLKFDGDGLLQAKRPWEWVFMILAIGVTPAVCEEFLFRGYFQRTLERTLRAPMLYLVSGTIFALIHQNYFGLIQLTLVGIYLGFVYHRAGSLLASGAAHFSYNTALVIFVNTPAS